MKFKIMIDCDYVVGHLRNGHKEGIIELENEEELQKMIETKEIVDYLDLIVDDYEVDDYSTNFDSLQYKEVE